MATDNLLRRKTSSEIALSNITFFGLFKTSFKNFFSNIKFFLPVALIFAVLAAFLALAIFYFDIANMTYFAEAGRLGFYVKPLPGKDIEFIAFVLLSVVIGVLFSLFIICACVDIVGEKAVNVWSYVKFVLLKFFRWIWLSIRIFWYVAVWPILIMFLFVVGLVVFVVAQGIAIFQSLGGFDAILNGSMMSRIGSYDLESLSTKIPVDFSAALTSPMVLILGILSLFVVISIFLIFIIRGTKSIFSAYAMVSDDLTAGESLDMSKELVKGNFWKVFLSYLGIVVFIMICFYVLLLPILLVNIEWDYVLISVAVSIYFIVNFLAMGILSVFLADFYSRIKKAKGL